MRISIHISVILLLFGCRNTTPHIEEGIRTINGTELYTMTMGQGDPVLVIHGGPGLNHRYFLPYLDPLARTHQLIFYDQRACGKSSVQVDTNAITLNNFIEDIEGLRKAYGITRLNLLAHSWGGLLALKYAIRYPGNIKTMILVDAIGASSAPNSEANRILADRFTPEDNDHRAAIIRSKEFEQRDPEAIEALMKIAFKHQFYNTAFLDSLRLGLDENYGETSRLLQYLGSEVITFDFQSDLKNITTPTLLIYGRYDPLTELVGDGLARNMNNAEYVVINQCGHFPFIEQQDKFMQIVTKFLGEHH